MNVQIIRFLDVWLKGLCLKICNTVRCNKRSVSQDSSTVGKTNFDPVPRSNSPWFLQCPKLCGEAEDVEIHVDRYRCKEVDEWGTGWVCPPQAGLLDSLASRISVELTVEGSRFPLVLSMLHVKCRMKWVRNSCCRKRLPNNCVMGPVEP